jgi:N-glycosylase/DNA lyase
MEILLNDSCPFSLDTTLCCGQAFRWSKQNGWWYGVADQKVFKVRQVDARLEFENVNDAFFRDYFGLRDDLPRILREISKDNHIRKAVEIHRGLRILRQAPWECLISYICATYKNIPAIEKMLFNLSRGFGDEVILDGYRFYTFPTSERLARATVEELAECGLGYRAKYVSETARRVCECLCDFEGLRSMSYEGARGELMDFPGVGLKVADCVLLFSLGKLEAFPVDVWVKRALLRHYGKHFSRAFIRRASGERSLANSGYEMLSRFGRRYFGQYAGYAQEYLYHYERTGG